MGVTVVTKRNGDGATRPRRGDRVEVHYTGTLEDGTQFDSSRDRGVPFEFNLGQGQVIKGWDEGISQLTLGERAILTVSPDFGYGGRAMGPIPPNSTLIFDVELVNVGGEGSGQQPTIWNTAVAAVLLAALTALVLHGLRETFQKHSFSDHFFS